MSKWIERRIKHLENNLKDREIVLKYAKHTVSAKRVKKRIKDIKETIELYKLRN